MYRYFRREALVDGRGELVLRGLCRFVRFLSVHRGAARGAHVLFDGLEDACVGVARHFNTYRACYSLAKIIEVLMRDGMSHEEALEHYEINIAGAWVGDGTPIILEEGALGES